MCDHHDNGNSSITLNQKYITTGRAVGDNKLVAVYMFIVFTLSVVTYVIAYAPEINKSSFPDDMTNDALKVSCVSYENEMNDPPD